MHNITNQHYQNTHKLIRFMPMPLEMEPTNGKSLRRTVIRGNSGERFLAAIHCVKALYKNFRNNLSNSLILFSISLP
jgi:hypothetical protein